MKKMMLKMSARERLYLIAGGAVLLLGVVVYPATKAAAAYRQEQLEMLSDESSLLSDFTGLLDDADAIQLENEQLRTALHSADDLLFPPIENPIMTQTMMIKLLNELGPDLDLEVSPGRSSVGDSANQMNLAIKGQGRYPEILKFLYRLETHRPLILVDGMTIAAPKPRKVDTKRLDKNTGKPKKPVADKAKDPGMFFRLTIQINCRDLEEGE
ncbi:MAG: hypothetical protein K9M54_07485 [Kiritimatiellales bacterium]|nr:hypothetical protein [Kiritimatiellales bacterium]MCF7864251.1 hypothetical protein [Kiritimatiellales bacterium]